MNEERKNVHELWHPVKDFQDGNIMVRVTRNSGYRPRYSLEIGRAILPANEDMSQPKVIRHFGVFIDTNPAKRVEIRESIATRVSRLISEAEGWIRDKSQEREDEILNERIERDERSANKGKLNARQTGKTEKNRSKNK